MLYNYLLYGHSDRYGTLTTLARVYFWVITPIYFRLATIINLIIAINVSRLLCKALQTYK